MVRDVDSGNSRGTDRISLRFFTFVPPNHIELLLSGRKVPLPLATSSTSVIDPTVAHDDQFEVTCNYRATEQGSALLNHR
jgi:hypothetical protein